jgi:hypothetical protein
VVGRHCGGELLYGCETRVFQEDLLHEQMKMCREPNMLSGKNHKTREKR